MGVHGHFKGETSDNAIRRMGRPNFPSAQRTDVKWHINYSKMWTTKDEKGFRDSHKTRSRAKDTSLKFITPYLQLY